MGDHGLPKRVMSGELESAEKREPGGKEKEWTDCVVQRIYGYLAVKQAFLLGAAS